MITVTVLGQEKTLRNEFGEYSLNEFETIVFAARDNDEFIERYVEIFKLLGLTDEEIDSMEVDEFLDLTKRFRMSDWSVNVFVPKITVDGKEYVSFTGETYKLSVSDLSRIESFIKKNQQSFLGELLGVVYKDPELSKKDNLSDENIMKRANLFRQHVKADIALPFINLILGKVLNRLNVEAQ